MKQVVLQAGESRGLAGQPARVKASSEDCDERFCVLESAIAAGQGPAMLFQTRITFVRIFTIKSAVGGGLGCPERHVLEGHVRIG